jgi:hypothetical protein
MKKKKSVSKKRITSSDKVEDKIRASLSEELIQKINKIGYEKYMNEMFNKIEKDHQRKKK